MSYSFPYTVFPLSLCIFSFESGVGMFGGDLTSVLLQKLVELLSGECLNVLRSVAKPGLD